MKKLKILFLLCTLVVTLGWPFLLLALSGCTVTTGPVVHTPEPQPHGGTCESAVENVKKLGGCGMHLDTLLQDCKDEESRSSVPLPHDCVTEAKTCDVMLACS